MLISLEVNGPNSLVRKSVRIPKLARASANNSVMPLSKSPSGLIVAAMREPTFAFSR
jgi:hypothetical protein